MYVQNFFVYSKDNSSQFIVVFLKISAKLNVISTYTDLSRFLKIETNKVIDYYYPYCIRSAYIIKKKKRINLKRNV